ncbi:hypothetical protein OAH87_05350 [Marinomonas sp.]|nr:hypothetical protein [Marinomonas sp.]MDB4837878.1 hypothetical protein [Marinomonas sp.]
MVLLLRILLQFFLLGVFIQSVHANEEPVSDDGVHEQTANFMFGLGYGLLNEKSLVNIDLNINMPINGALFTQIQLNSNYLATGSTTDSFAQSELSSNWFLHNEYGRLGVGIGVNELEPLDEEQETEREVLGQLIGSFYMNSWSVSARYISNDTAFSNITSSRLGLSYFLHDNHRVSFYREKYSENNTGWRLENYYQPKKHKQALGMGWIVRTSDDYDYLGFIVQYYFDYKLSLRERAVMDH